MTDTKPEETTTSKRPAGSRLQHVVVHFGDSNPSNTTSFDDVIVHGQELDALRSIVGKPDWRYVAVPHGASVAEALKAAGS